MWKIRFKSSDYNEAKSALDKIDSDPRKEADTFLSTKLWQSTGYYASGYEMTFDAPALVHGVAYVCHLQSELHWRGDKVPLLKDIQHRFIAALEYYMGINLNLHFLFMLFYLLRDTVHLFTLFPDASSTNERLSFQFSNTAAAAAHMALPPSAAAASANADRIRLFLSSKTESLSRNIYNWSRVGQIAREEKWVYNFLLRDISHLISKLTNTISTNPSYLERKETFSEAFSKACGERSNDERYWKCRIVTIVERDRCRLIEKVSGATQKAGDLDQSSSLYSSAIVCRPQQPRLLYRRAQIRAAQEKWKECLADIRKAVAMVENRKHVAVTASGCPKPQKCLLVDLFALEGDVLVERSKEVNSNSLANAKAALNSYEKAMELEMQENKINAELRTKLAVASRIHESLLTRSAKLKGNKKRKSKRTKEEDTFTASEGTEGKAAVTVVGEHDSQGAIGSSSSQVSSVTRGRETTETSTGSENPRVTTKLVRETNVQNESSSEEEMEDESLAGNPYAALLPGGVPTRSPEQSAQVPDPTQKPNKFYRNNARSRTVQAARRTTPHKSAGVGAKKTRQTQNDKQNGESNNMASHADSQVLCTLCNVSLSGRADYESHMRGRRHRTAVSNARIDKVEGGSSSHHSWQPASSSTSPGHQHIPAVANDYSTSFTGPTREEALAEAERAMAILGGEARPCDVVARMNFSKWSIQNVNAYLDSEFGGLLRLCLSQPNIFELRPGSESRPVLMLINRVRGPTRRRTGTIRTLVSRAGPSRAVTVPTRTVSDHTPSRFPLDDGDFPALDSHRHELAVSHRRQMMSNLPRVPERDAPIQGGSQPNKLPVCQEKASTVGLEAKDLDTCGICYDNVPDVRCMPCRHEWCDDCIMDNIRRGRVECPMCMGTVSHLERLVGELD